MRSKLTYLLLLCLLFYKGYVYVLHGEHKQSSGHSPVQGIQNNHSDDLSGQQNNVALLQGSLLNDDNEDDEFESPGKKRSLYGSGSTNTTLSALSYLSKFLNSDQRPGKLFFYSPDKNIFLRVMKL